MNLTISHLKSWLECPRKAHNLHVLKRGPLSEPDALRTGTAVHEAMAAKLRGGYLAVSDETAQILMDAVKDWRPPVDWKIKHVEKAMTAWVGKHTLQGRLDALVWWNGGWWSLQWKTVASSKPLDKLVESVRIGWHECGYQHLAVSNGFEPFHGTILGTFRKLSGAARARGEPVFALHYLARTPQGVAERMEALATYADWMEQSTNQKNPEACFGAFGNSRCPFFGVCHEGHDLADPTLYRDLPDRYADLQATDGDG